MNWQTFMAIKATYSTSCKLGSIKHCFPRIKIANPTFWPIMNVGWLISTTLQTHRIFSMGLLRNTLPFNLCFYLLKAFLQITYIWTIHYSLKLSLSLSLTHTHKWMQSFFHIAGALSQLCLTVGTHVSQHVLLFMQCSRDPHQT